MLSSLHSSLCFDGGSLPMLESKVNWEVILLFIRIKLFITSCLVVPRCSCDANKTRRQLGNVTYRLCCLSEYSKYTQVRLYMGFLMTFNAVTQPWERIPWRADIGVHVYGKSDRVRGL